MFFGRNALYNCWHSYCLIYRKGPMNLVFLVEFIGQTDCKSYQGLEAGEGAAQIDLSLRR